jgi:hypothetical protein
VTNLRRAPDRFIGRTEERARLHALDAEDRPLITLAGPPGVGKSRLALEHLLQAPGPPVWHIELADLEQPTDLLAAVAETLDLTVPFETDDPTWPRRLGRALDRRGPLRLFLDDADRLLPDLAGIVEQMLREAPRLRVVLEVPPLGAEGIDLLAERAISSLPTLADDPDRRDILTRIVERLDGLPLAIELAAGRLAVLSPEQLAERLDRRFEVLRSADGRDHRHATLEHTIRASLELLRPDDRRVLTACALFPATFDADGAEAVAGATLDHLQRLRGRSLLMSTPGRVRRFRLLHAVRELLAEEMDDVSAGLALLASFAGARATRLLEDLEGPRPVAALEQMAAEIPLLRTVVAGPSSEQLWPCAAVLALFAERSGLRSDLIETLRGALEHGDSALGCLVLGRLLRLRGEMANAEASLSRGLKLAAPPQLHRRLQLEQVRLLRHRGRLRAARDAALAVVGEAEDAVVQIEASTELGLCRHGRGNLTGAAETLERAVGLARKGRPLRLAEALLALGRVESDRSRSAAASRLLTEALDIFIETEDLRGQADAHEALAEVAAHRGSAGEALAMLRTAESLRATLGDARGAARTHERTARIAAGPELRRAALEAAEKAWLEAGDATAASACACRLGEADWQAGRIAEAARMFELAVSRAAKSGDTEASMRARSFRAALGADRGEPGAAAEFAEVAASMERTTLRTVPAEVLILPAHLDLARKDVAGALDRATEGFRLARGRSDAADRALRRLRPRIPTARWLEHWEATLDPGNQALVVDGHERFRAPGGDWVDLRRRSQLGRLLNLLAGSSEPVPDDRILEELYPDERMLPEAAAMRLQQAVSRLRKAGLGDHLERFELGYRIRPTTRVVRIPGRADQ